ncbi:hypothetical protein FPV67DRAFT_1764688 [Lyophyllum atratum]|nr:hypothetical protein FPV67DRAFT_1764688 [Lyophyllum atratum]
MPRSPPTFTQTWGCQMISYMFNAVLYGIGLLMVMQYFHSHSKKDSSLTKATVAILFSLATVQMTFLSHQIYLDFVTWFAHPEFLDEIPFTSRLFAPLNDNNDADGMKTMLLATYSTAFTAQLFFASRIWVFASEGKKLLCTVPVKITSTQAGSTAACDVVITSMLCWLLNSSRSGIKRTDGIVHKLIVYAINRGVATSLAAVMNLILFVAIPDTFVFMIFLLPSSQLYVLSVVSMLTTRGALRDKLSTDHTSFPLENLRGRAPQSDGIHVHQAVVTWKGEQAPGQHHDLDNITEAEEGKGSYLAPA